MLFILATLFGRKKKLTALGREELEATEDEALMARYAQGDVAAFDVLLTRHERKILNFIYRSVGDRGRAEEMTQDVFLKVVRNAPKYKPTAKFTTWIFTIARNACIDESRKRQRRQTYSLDAPLKSNEQGGATFLDRTIDPEAKSGTAQLARAEFRGALKEALVALPDAQREVFILRHYEGMRFVDIARMLDVSDNTIKSRMRYALATLRGALASFEELSFDEMETEEVGS